MAGVVTTEHRKVSMYKRKIKSCKWKSTCKSTCERTDMRAHIVEHRESIHVRAERRAHIEEHTCESI